MKKHDRWTRDDDGGREFDDARTRIEARDVDGTEREFAIDRGLVIKDSRRGIARRRRRGGRM